MTLPPLPTSNFPDPRYGMSVHPAYSADQMREYGDARAEHARKQALEEAAQLCEEVADKLTQGRSNQVDRHVADVLDRRAEAIRSLIK